MPGFWETFASKSQDALGDYDRQRQDKRQRALQKLKFLTETGDVGTEVDPQAADLIKRHADEGAGMIADDNTFTGTPEQQRMHAWRQSVEQNPDMDPMDMLMQGTAQGAISGNALSNYLNSVESRTSREALTREQIASREDMARENRLSREELARENMQNRLDIRGMINANQGGRDVDPDGLSPGGTRGDTQKFLANRKMFGNDPLGYIKNTVLGNEQSALRELQALHADESKSGVTPNWQPNVRSPEAWEAYAMYHERPDVMQNEIQDRGMTPQEYRELVQTLRKAAATARKRNASTQQQ